ncbi:FecR family protein [Paraflavitalea pollutisoli]|uniref:FecR family protein n=1 Tax=Paraflavitalea pollutisoli TaxID=3034143 RepID=UPI0023EBF95C|nr:FecR family protein [Paraflavitalea sp. H1-2-19X]
MKITNALIQKFLDNQCTPTEAEAVSRHLKQYPDLAATYLRSSWGAAEGANELPAGYKAAMMQEIQVQIARHRRVVRFRWAAAAASLLIGTAAVWLFMPSAKTPAAALAERTEKKPVATASWKVQTNTAAKAYRFKLEDGTLVKLAPHAVVRYQEPFGRENKRTIYMEGEADFDVAPDKARPFTVHTKWFATTALGTAFKVSEKATSCQVRLFHGKVLIKSLVKSLKGWKKDVVLLPGHEMKYSVSAGTVTVEPFQVAPNRPTSTAVDQVPYQDENTLVFDNTPLPVVMKSLTDRYHTTIFYDEEQLKGKYFSGEVLKGDSLSVLLSVIANMNGLSVTKKEDIYIITQSK